MTVGWFKIKKNRYYFNEKGIMSTGTVVLKNNEYTFSSNGVWNQISNISIGEVKEKIAAAAPKEAYSGVYNNDDFILSSTFFCIP